VRFGDLGRVAVDFDAASKEREKETLRGFTCGKLERKYKREPIFYKGERSSHFRQDASGARRRAR